MPAPAPENPVSHHVTNWRDRINLGHVLMAAGIAVLVIFALYLHSDAASHRQAAAASDRSRAAYESLSKRLVATNDANCKNAGRKCVGDSKQVVKSLPTSVQSQVAPATHAVTPVPGRNGRGIVSTAITTGRLFVTYSDGTTTDVGQVVGRTGKTGPSGKPGRGITSTAVSSGDLLVSYTDGSSKNLGRVVGHDGTNGHNGTDGKDGPAGRGIASTTIVSGHLIVAYTDNTADDVGQVVGKDGVNGLNGASITNATVNGDGDLIITISTPQADGTTTTKTIDAGHVVGKDGTDGKDGPAGRGVSDTEVTDEADGSCHLIVTYSDGTTHDAGAVGCPTSTTTPTPPASPTGSTIPTSTGSTP